ncbi:MAG: hypothetical protein ACO35I_08755, partial [Burkholderiaceae bacterium]
MKDQLNFYDEETREWLEALDDILASEGPDKASFILSKLAERLTQQGSSPSFNLTTPFRNTIPINEEA